MPDENLIEQEIAHHLGPEWRVEDRGYYHKALIGPDMELYTRLAGPIQQRKLHIGFILDHNLATYMDPAIERVAIAVNAYRPAQDIAREIKRRLLPVASKLMIELRALEAEDKKREDLLLEGLTQLALVFGRQPQSKDMDSKSLYLPLNQGRGELNIKGGGVVDFRLSCLPIDTAMQICRVLANMEKDND